ncbi:MAG TPA: MarR family winged helix-turn-helix transcriptional regulator [Pseudonocardiaceae bacterium]|jgi:DNA-binding MarR family transcriptional regulator
MASADFGEAAGGSLAGCAAAGIEHDLGWAITTIGRAFQQWASASVANLPGGQRAYLVLVTADTGHPRTQLALAGQLGIDKTAMTYLIDGLERAGLVERRLDPADRRARQVLVTAQGHAALAEAAARLAGIEGRLLAPLGQDEARQFRDLLGRIAAATKTEVTNRPL